jgi:hypothetical protein
VVSCPPDKTVRSLGLQDRCPAPNCWRGAHAITLPATKINKRPEALARSAGPQKTEEHRGLSEVTSISFLPTTFTTLFALAAALLLGYI